MAAAAAAAECAGAGDPEISLPATFRGNTKMSIFRIYINNGNFAGFWIQHRSWKNICARVLRINGRFAGALPGSCPSYDHAHVELEYFDVRSGRAISSKPLIDRPDHLGYTVIAQPPWYRPVVGAAIPGVTRLS
jgi:hypothetical protein